VWASLEQVAAHEPYSITDGPFGSNLKTEHYTDQGPRVIRLQNIGEGDFINAEAHISEQHFETLRRHQVFPRDLIIAALGESLPRACLVPESLGPAIVKADCIRFKPHALLAISQYLNAALNSEVMKRAASRIVHGIGRPRLNQQEIKALPAPLPPLAEQHRIVAEVERRLSVVAEVEATVAANLKRAERLRQSVLKRAFEGRLVPQDPSEASVEALLSAATPLEHQTENVALNRATAPAETLADEAPQRKRGRPSKVRQERLEGM
jgi:type I restriction enzyme S subunit